MMRVILRPAAKAPRLTLPSKNNRTEDINRRTEASSTGIIICLTETPSVGVIISLQCKHSRQQVGSEHLKRKSDVCEGCEHGVEPETCVFYYFSGMNTRLYSVIYVQHPTLQSFTPKAPPPTSHRKTVP